MQEEDRRRDAEKKATAAYGSIGAAAVDAYKGVNTSSRELMIAEYFAQIIQQLHEQIVALSDLRDRLPASYLQSGVRRLPPTLRPR